jgi:hypothetical protein
LLGAVELKICDRYIAPVFGEANRNSVTEACGSASNQGYLSRKVEKAFEPV